MERRERAQATVIENQAKRLDELETLYKVCALSCALHCTVGQVNLKGQLSQRSAHEIFLLPTSTEQTLLDLLE